MPKLRPDAMSLAEAVEYILNDEVYEAALAHVQEVREVLAEVVREHDDPTSDYGCTTHTTERARVLMAQLRVDGAS